MDRKTLGLLIIGQTPRPDLAAPLERLANRCDLFVRGALDPLTAADLPDPTGAAYPLTTRLRDGTPVIVDEAFLTPLLQQALDELEGEDVVATVLLCAGPFIGLRSRRPLLRPFSLAARMLGACGVNRLSVIVPTDEQRGPSLRKFTAAGFSPVAWSMAARPEDRTVVDWLAACVAETDPLDAVVLDYVGYPLETLHQLQQRLSVPVFDLGHLAIATLEAMV